MNEMLKQVQHDGSGTFRNSNYLPKMLWLNKPPHLIGIIYMYFVYILKSIEHKRLYIGYTNNLVNRIKEHNGGLSFATKPYLPWQIVYYESYRIEAEAKHREHNLKLRSNAWNQLKRRINKSINAD